MAEPQNTAISWDTLKAGSAALMTAGSMLPAPDAALAAPAPRPIVVASFEIRTGILARAGSHADAVNGVLKSGNAGKNVEVRHVDDLSLSKFQNALSPKDSTYWHMDRHPEKDPLTRETLKNVDVLNRSTGIQTFIKNSETESANFAAQKVRTTIPFWSAQKTIIVQAVGNSGQNPDADRSKEPSPLIYNRKWLQVGAAELKSGVLKAADYSSAADPSYITRNPFEQGFNTPFYKKPGQILEESITRYNSTLPEEYWGCTKSVPAPATQETWAKSEKGREHVRKCVTDIFNTLADKNGNSKEMLLGTSFTAPNSAKDIGGVMSSKPGLTPEAYVAATLFAARPLESDARLHYIPNGSGVSSYDITGKTGLGLVEGARLNQVVQSMLDLQKSNPALKTTPHTADSGTILFRKPSAVEQHPINFEDRTNNYRLPVGEDSTNLRTALEIRLKGKFNVNNPPEMELTSPQGVKIPLVTTAAGGNNPTIYASTNAFFGTASKGDWTLSVKNNEVDSASITIGGLERGGLIDAYIARNKQDTPQAAAKADPAQPAPERRTSFFDNLGPRTYQ
ncbi:MAG: hypothetical protein JWO78_1285 [Micavibrio sp.]|nr:hypothetical protein [Micavibrio sp.]